MKDVSKIFIVLVTIGCCSAFCGCDGSGPSEPSAETTQNVNELRQKIKSMESTISDQRMENTTLNIDNQKLREDNQKLTEERDEAQSVARRRYITLSIIAYTALALGIILIVGFFLLIARSSGGKDSLVTKKNDLHCPRCGWEHRPEETVCKNCKTHF